MGTNRKQLRESSLYEKMAVAVATGTAAGCCDRRSRLGDDVLMMLASKDLG